MWQYIAEEELEVPSIYFAHEREVFSRDGMLYAVSPFVEMIDGEEAFTASVRYRTVGDMSCTGAVESDAATLAEVVAEIAATEVTERGADARRRPRHRGRDGGSQAAGVLLMRATASTIEHARDERRRAAAAGRRRASRRTRAADVFRRLADRPSDLLRFATAGSVDDGKSTLIGRLLYDSKQVLARPARARRAGEPAHAATTSSTCRC